MPLITGERVAVPPEFEDREQTIALNEAGVYGRSMAQQSNGVTYSAQADTTTTVSADFICTGIFFTAYAANDTGASSSSMEVTIGGKIVLGCAVSGDNSTGVASAGFCPIPNWLVKRGETIVFNEGGSSGNASATVVGYLV